MGEVPRRRFLGWTGAAVASVVSLPLAVSSCATAPPERLTQRPAGPVVTLPSARTTGPMDLEQAIGEPPVRAVVLDDALPLAVVSQLLWAGQGVTHDGWLRTAPSAGALYALELYASDRSGTLRYLPEGHQAEQWSTRDQRAELAQCGGRPESLVGAAAILVVTVTPSRLAGKYGARSTRYATLEAGHATQNVLLQATALDLGAVPVGSFDDAALATVLGLPAGESGVYLVAVGREAT